LADPQGRRAAALAEPEDPRPPDGPGNQQVDGVGGGQAEALLLSAQDLLSAVVQEPVAGEMLEVPMLVAGAAIELERPDPSAAPDGASARAVLGGGHCARPDGPVALHDQWRRSGVPHGGAEGEHVAGADPVDLDP